MADSETDTPLQYRDGKTYLEAVGELRTWLLDKYVEKTVGLKGDPGKPGEDGEDGEDGAKGDPGTPGADAYEIARTGGYGGTRAQWLASLKGEPGASAYDLARAGGYGGTEAAWLASLKGVKGDPGAASTVAGPTGQSAYQAWLAAGNTGDVSAFIASLKGAKGDTGPASVPEAAGSYTFASTAPGGSPSVLISFPTGRFSSPPKVVLGCDQSAFIPTVSNKTATEFRIYANNVSTNKTVGVTVEWYATAAS